MLRRLHHDQPESFAFTPDNQRWAEAEITKYPEPRRASAVIALLWRAQEQEGWLSRAAIEHVADMLGLAHIRALEVATFYFMFQLAPVGSVAHVQICGTTSCMICGAEDLIGVCREKIAGKPYERSPDGKFSWEEVECLGACANAPMAQIGKDYYEDLTRERMAEILDEMAAGRLPQPGPQTGRYASEPVGGLTSLAGHADDRPKHNASVALAADLGDTLRRIDGSELPIRTLWRSQRSSDVALTPKEAPELSEGAPIDDTGVDTREAPEKGRAHPRPNEPAEAVDGRDGSTGAGAGQGAKPTVEETRPRDSGSVAEKSHAMSAGTGNTGEGAVGNGAPGRRPAGLEGPRDGRADNLKRIKGIGPKLEKLLNELGFFHFDQIAEWDAEEIAWVDANLEGFRGRIERDDWVEQAGRLAAGGETKG